MPGKGNGTWRIRAEGAPICVTGVAGSGLPAGSAARALLCDQRDIYLPSVATVGGTNARSEAQPAVNEQSAEPFAANATVAQDLVLVGGGQLRFAGFGSVCLDVRDVFNADYIAGEGGPQPGQIVS